MKDSSEWENRKRQETADGLYIAHAPSKPNPYTADNETTGKASGHRKHKNTTNCKKNTQGMRTSTHKKTNCANKTA